MFPPGRARLATNPARTGSIPQNAITMGTVRVASLAALIAGGLTATMTSTLARLRSAARAGRRAVGTATFKEEVLTFHPSQFSHPPVGYGSRGRKDTDAHDLPYLLGLRRERGSEHH